MYIHILPIQFRVTACCIYSEWWIAVPHPLTMTGLIPQPNLLSALLMHEGSSNINDFWSSTEMYLCKYVWFSAPSHYDVMIWNRFRITGPLWEEAHYDFVVVSLKKLNPPRQGSVLLKLWNTLVIFFKLSCKPFETSVFSSAHLLNSDIPCFHHSVHVSKNRWPI